MPIVEPVIKDVVHKRCEEEGCGKIPAFNSPNEKKPRFCGSYKRDGMKDVRNNRFEEEYLCSFLI